MIAPLLIALGFVIGLAVALIALNLIIDRWPVTPHSPAFPLSRFPSSPPRWLALLYLALICTPPALAIEAWWRRAHREQIREALSAPAPAFPLSHPPTFPRRQRNPGDGQP